MIKIAYPFIYLENKATSLIFEVKPFSYEEQSPFYGKNIITIRYYGPKLKENNFAESPSFINKKGSNDHHHLESVITSTFGDGNNKTPSLLIENTNQTYINRFFFKECRVIKEPLKIIGPHARHPLETLEIIEDDDFNKVSIHTYYSLFSNSSVIAVKKKIVNQNDKPITLLKAASLELALPTHDLSVYSFDGAWLYERSRHETRLSAGTFVIDSKSGSSSHHQNPFFQIHDHQSDLKYAFNLIYSGNHKEEMEVDSLAGSKVIIGINDYLFAYGINPGESFITPEAVMVVAPSFDELTTEMHHFVLNQIINPNFNNKPRPIVFNSWEGTGMNINEQSLLEMADVARSVGIELFVMDDGWFKNRVDATQALGDWEADITKFPHGLKAFVDQIKEKGLQFGIWVEPEMISQNSDLFKKHPQFASRVPGLSPLKRRHQLMVDMTNPEVVDYLDKRLSLLIEEIEPDYIKWDYNRFMSDNFSSIGIPSGEYMHRYIQGTYTLLERLTKKFPKLLIESCASGGGRFDLGMHYYAPQAWGSDNSNTYWRIFITTGTLAGYPQSTFGAHVSRDGNPHPSKGGTSSLEDRFNLQCFGAFGYELDLRKVSQADLEIIKKQIDFYKKNRDLLQFGTYYSLENCFDNPNYSSFIVVDEHQENAIMFVGETKLNIEPMRWKAKGLDPDGLYAVSLREQANLVTNALPISNYRGQTLMEEGLDLGRLSQTKDVDIYYKGIYTRLVILRKVT